MPWFIETKDNEFCVIKGTKEVPLDEVACHPTRPEATAQLRALYASEAKATPGNHLKAVFSPEGEYRVANYIVLWGDENKRDAEGVFSKNQNADGTIGEFFTKSTELDSIYTDTGHLFVDWEHGQQKDGEVSPPKDEVFGWVDWKTAQPDDIGLWVERVLSRRSRYMDAVKVMIGAGKLGTSSKAIPHQVTKKSTGEIEKWPMWRDTFTVEPMEYRMMDTNVIQAAKSLGLLIEPEPQEPEAQPEADNTAVEAARVRLARIKLKSLLEVK